MRNPALCVAFILLLVPFFAADPAAAACQQVEGPVTVKVCDDQNGNLTPDQVSATSPVASASYREAGRSDIDANVGSGATGAQVDASCSGVIGDPTLDCNSLAVNAAAPPTKVWANYNSGPGPNTWICYRLEAAGTVLIECVRVPHPLPPP